MYEGRMMDSDDMPQRKSGVRQQKEYLEMELERFNKLVETFADRLSPVLIPDYPNTNDKMLATDRAEPSSDLAGELERYVDHLRTVGSKFDRLLSRIDL